MALQVLTNKAKVYMGERMYQVEWNRGTDEVSLTDRLDFLNLEIHDIISGDCINRRFLHA